MIRLIAHPDCCCCVNQLQLTVALTDSLAKSYDGQTRHETHLFLIFSSAAASCTIPKDVVAVCVSKCWENFI